MTPPALAEQLPLLPPELAVDTSDRSRGIRISLGAGALRRLRRPHPRATQTAVWWAGIDCAGAATDDASIRDLEYAIVDVETTGGSWQRGHRITEIAAVRLRGDGTVVDEYRTLVNPERPIPHFITALTSISWEMVRDAPRFAEIGGDVARVLGGAVFVAHNASFDWRFVAAELERAGSTLTGRSLCTVRLARKVVPEVKSRSLDSLSWFFDIPNEARHRAYGDALATAEVFRRLLERLDEQEVQRWHELQTLLKRRPRKKRRRIANPHSMEEV